MRVTVFCGSSSGNESFVSVARSFGEFLAIKKHTVIYGGGSVGLMGALANGVMACNGKIIGIIPKRLYEKEAGNEKITKLIQVDTMHERKALMSDMCDAFVILPGGLGTLEEAFEVWTHSQLGYHSKPIGFLNLDGFYDRLFEFLNFASRSGFIDKKFVDMVVVDDDYKALFRQLKEYEAPKSKY